LRTIEAAHLDDVFRSSQTLVDRALGMTYSVKVDAQGPLFRVDRLRDGAFEELRPRYVIGSGRFGYTFVFERDGKFMESRLSYYPPAKQWGWTPGQRDQNPFRAPMGSLLQNGREIACFICHSTYLVRENSQIHPERSRANVGCQRCHGPAKAHLEAVKAGKAPGPIYRYTSASQETIMRLCGDCHRSPGAIPENELDTDPNLARFSGTALALSKCYQNSAGTLTCVSCHNPHPKVSHDLSRYEAVCRSCHDRATAKAPGHTARLCAVNQKSGCVSCHMPAVSVGEPAEVKFRHHWIRVWPKEKSDAGA